ncbi:MAG: hypothetical protein WAZ66_01130, partial [Enterococcus aquimarinus]
MRQRENEYERAVALSTVTSTDSSSFNIIRRSNQNAETFFNANNIVISGCGSMKQNLLISLLAEHQSLPIIIITDEQRSRLAMTLQNTMSANFSFVRHNKESSCYNFLRHKSTPEMVQFFTQIANENGLFEQRRVESELLLRSILQLS